MRKLLLVPLAALLLVGCGERKNRLEDQEWPAGLGKLSSVPARYPDKALNASAERLIVLAQAAGVDLRPGSRPQDERLPQIWTDIRDYVRDEIRHAGVAPPGPLPESVADYLKKHEAALLELRQHLITAPPAEWPQRIGAGLEEAPVPNHLGQIRLARLLVAAALEKKDWAWLHAAWKLDEQLHRRPDVTSHVIAVAIVRQINAAARSMPLPEPAWIAAMRARDYRRPIFHAMQAEAWMGQQLLAKKESGFFDRLGAADRNDDYMITLKELASQPECATDDDSDGWWNEIDVPELRGSLQRIGRLRVELEATEKLALARQGRFDGRSRCPGQQWVLENGIVRFSQKLPAVPPPDAAAPTELPVTLPRQST